MSPDKQRIAISTACGWKNCRIINPGVWARFYGKHPLDSSSSEGFAGLPDYLNDLNAMHEAEKVKAIRYNWSDFGRYQNELMKLCGHEPRMCSVATAAQRAEAFLRTLGKWEDAR